MILYHKVPSNVEGSVLYPLSCLKEFNPSKYSQNIKKYSGRENVLDTWLPGLECRWNDVLQLTTIYPGKIQKTFARIGLKWTDKQWFPVDTKVFGFNRTNAALWVRSPIKFDCKVPAKFNCRIPPEELHLWDQELEGKISSRLEIPDYTIRYYRYMHEKKQRPFLFVGMDHVFYRGKLELSKVDIINIP